MENLKKTHDRNELSPQYGRVTLVSWCTQLMDVYQQVKHRLRDSILARKFDIWHWFPCGSDRWADVRSCDYQNIPDGQITKLSPLFFLGDRTKRSLHIQNWSNLFNWFAASIICENSAASKCPLALDKTKCFLK